MTDQSPREPTSTGQDDVDDAPLDAAAALELLTRQQIDVDRRLAAGLPLILFAWGIAWTVGFGMLWLIDGLAPGFRMPLPIAVVTFIVLMVGALVVSAVVGARMGRGIRASADAAWTGTVFGLTWPVGYIAIWSLASVLVHYGMPRELLNIYYPTASVMFVGLMYIVAGAIWRNWQSIAMGGWITLVACIAPWFGYPTHYLVFAIAAGGVFLVAGCFTAVWIGRASPAAVWGWGRGR
jgi:hypothetical protein